LQEAVHKRQGERGFVKRGQGGRGSSDVDTALFGAKIIGFFQNLCDVSAQTRGVEPLRTFFGQEGRGLIFRDFVQTSFMDGP